MPRAGLSEDRVVTEAELLADEIGLPQLTLAAVAERLGVRQPSLYKHVAGMSGLQRSISIRAKLELADVMARAAVGRSGADAITAMSGAYRQWAVGHPGRYEASQWAPPAGDTEDEAASSSLIQICLEILTSYQLRGDDAVDAMRALRSTLHGFVTLESGGGFNLPADIDRSFERLIEGLNVALSNWNRAPVTSGN